MTGSFTGSRISHSLQHDQLSNPNNSSKGSYGSHFGKIPNSGTAIRGDANCLSSNNEGGNLGAATGMMGITGITGISNNLNLEVNECDKINNSKFLN